ncbi:hypothetical protein GCM10007160_06920 [Litchfieldella qijiaojingensis]|uniref:Uncharacterized protein n=1 Tax=Litchfieldella qijiaojingensis TaxID=980347 RepID=A0ABQ2YFS3_9GAMM|nr:hypothetical protein GCM10007160_06920 [Halomonas qijiaojingensis]
MPCMAGGIVRWPRSRTWGGESESAWGMRRCVEAKERKALEPGLPDVVILKVMVRKPVIYDWHMLAWRYI